jgi:uncharacterized SAM-binding protein YcdF (DUF218 family)
VLYSFKAIALLTKAATITIGATVLAVFIWTFFWPLERPMPQGDAIICLGAGVDGAGRIDAASLARAQACAGLARAEAAPIVIFTGGPSRPGAPSAAAGMADAAQSTGLGQALIILEQSAQSTLQNALYSLALLPDDARLILVTEAFHLPRAWASFRVMGAGDLALYPSERLRRAEGGGFALGMLTRESVALWFNAARFAAWRLGGVIGVDDSARADWLR